jgi:hypothetical protein
MVIQLLSWSVLLALADLNAMSFRVLLARKRTSEGVYRSATEQCAAV